MVLLEVDVACLAVLEFEGYAPGAVDMDAEASRRESMQRMEIEAGESQFRYILGDIETIEPDEDSPMHPGIDPARA